MKVVIHYWDGQSYTYTGFMCNLVSSNWYHGDFTVYGVASGKGDHTIPLDGVKYVEYIDPPLGRHSVFYRPSTRPNGAKSLSVNVDVMSSKQRTKVNQGTKKLQKLLEYVDYLDGGMAYDE